MSPPKIIRFAIVIPNEGFKSWQLAIVKKLFDFKTVNVELFIKKESSFSSATTISGFENTPLIDFPLQVDFSVDIILCFDYTDKIPFLITKANIGLWIFRFGDTSKYSFDTSSTWELINEDDASAAYLIQINQQNNCIVKEGFFKTLKGSVNKNFNSTHNACIQFLEQAIIEIVNELNINYLILPTLKSEFFENKKLSIVKLYLTVFKNNLKKYFRNYFLTDKWNVGIINAPIENFLSADYHPNITWMKELENTSFVADSFVINHQGATVVMVEHYAANKRKGIIAASTFLNQKFSSLKNVFEQPVHLSYPFLFKHQEIIYCIPEMNQSNEVALYKINSFPELWEKEAVLLSDFAAVDPTIFFNENKWWLFCTNKENKGADIRLYIFYADDLKGKWTPHLRNPVKTDIRSARPAGNIFVFQNKIYRPSQDSSKTYGGRIIINEIKKLSISDFEETFVSTLEPKQFSTKYTDGLHTISFHENFTVIDAKRTKFKFPFIN